MFFITIIFIIIYGKVGQGIYYKLILILYFFIFMLVFF